MRNRRSFEGKLGAGSCKAREGKEGAAFLEFFTPVGFESGATLLRERKVRGGGRKV